MWKVSGLERVCRARLDGDEKPASSDQRRSGDDLLTAAMVRPLCGRREWGKEHCCSLRVAFTCEKEEHMLGHPSRRRDDRQAGGEKAASVGERAERVTTGIT